MSATFTSGKRSCFVVEKEADLEEYLPLFKPSRFTYPKTLLRMKLLAESIRSFWEGFTSFYRTIYQGLKSW